MSEQQNKSEEQRRAEQRAAESEGRKPRHIARSTEGKPKEEDTKTYVVKEGQTWGTNPPLEAGDTVELTEAEAAGFEDKLEPADAAAKRGTEPPTGEPPAPAVPKRTS